MKKSKKINFTIYDVLGIVFSSSFVFLALGLCLIFLSFVSRSIGVIAEKDCVEFYNENGYILNECELYTEKLEG